MDVVQLWSMDATDVMRFKVCGARAIGRSQMEVKMEGSGNDLAKGG